LKNKTQIENTQKQTKSVFGQIMSELLSRTIKLSGCQSNGFRLQKKGNYPFYIHEGYPKFFIVKESNLLIKDVNKKVLYDQKGNKMLDCMCGNVINGHFDSSFPFFSNNGSFWTNSTTNLLSSITKEQREFVGSTRNICNLSGCESVALIPLKTEDNIIGLVHLADPRENMFTIKKISELEKIADEFASIIKRAYDITEKLHKIDKIIS